jgi:nucleoside permease NupC
MDSRSCQIATYALCGFANLPSIAIQIGGLSAMAPSRRSDFASIAPRAMVAGACACWMTGAVAGLFL